MDKLYSLANEVERLLQFVDANKTGNPGEVRFIIKRLREKIAETRENPNKHLEYPPEFVEALKYDQALKEYPTQNLETPPKKAMSSKAARMLAKYLFT